jgi:hypothetical protein
MLLESLIPKRYNSCSVHICENSTKYEIQIEDNLVEFFAPSIDGEVVTIKTEMFTPETVWYYTVVSGILFCYHDVIVSEIRIGDNFIPRSSIWKNYVEFEHSLLLKESSKNDISFHEIF